ncbi:MAG: DUF202 domain-containing protein [Thermodesulfobacteriota bacterium]
MSLDKDPSPPGEVDIPDGTIIGEIQLVLAEKRTSLAILRTGIAVLVVPLSVMSFLVVTSKSYVISHVWHILAVLILLCLGMVALACYLIVRSIRKLRKEDRLIQDIKRKHSRIAEFID